MNYYEILEISPNASEEVIKIAYKTLAKKYHPDLSTFEKQYSESMMKDLNVAFDIISDPVKRKEYDISIGTYSNKSKSENNTSNSNPTNNMYENNTKDTDIEHDNSSSTKKNDSGCLFTLIKYLIIAGILILIVSHLTNKKSPPVNTNTSNKALEFNKVPVEKNVKNPINPTTTTNDIVIGDYFQMGKYYGEQILWRCVDIDENGPLMLSDKIITIKGFDARGVHNYLDGNPQADFNNYRATSGSNLWETSNMRSWLNSTESAGNVIWLDGCPPTADNTSWNPYSNESGFLSDYNFTATEQNTIKSVTQKSLLNNLDAIKLGINGKNYKEEVDNLPGIDRSIDYYQNITDKIFLLDVNQLNKVYKNSSTLGTNYWMGQPTQKAVDNSTYKNSNDLSIYKYCYSWIRSPLAKSEFSMSVFRVGGPHANIDDYGNAIDGSVGVRPAFYINISSEILKSGNGSQTTPYIK